MLSRYHNLQTLPLFGNTKSQVFQSLMISSCRACCQEHENRFFPVEMTTPVLWVFLHDRNGNIIDEQPRTDLGTATRV